MTRFATQMKLAVGMVKDADLQTKELFTLGGSVIAHDASLHKLIDARNLTIGLITRCLEALAYLQWSPAPSPTVDDKTSPPASGVMPEDASCSIPGAMEGPAKDMQRRIAVLEDCLDAPAVLGTARPVILELLAASCRN